ncbi:MAG TPA: hypothetical protein PKI03_18205, partial [Pseudomonadota bacterium]|nr:hypothetical protein [Pseudomonadota bacterium]
AAGEVGAGDGAGGASGATSSRGGSAAATRKMSKKALPSDRQSTCAAGEKSDFAVNLKTIFIFFNSRIR